jgi:DNA-binding transcriptional ArsR family regulator
MTHSTPPQPDDEQIIYDLEALKVYFDPQRARIMQALAGAPRTVHEVADILDVPFTRLYYQFNLLEKHGFIRVVQTRSLAGAVIW